MQRRIDCISLPAEDLKRTAAFYRDGLGWPMDEAAEDADHIPLTLQNGSYLVFVQRPEFISFTDIVKLEAAPKGACGCILSYFCRDQRRGG
jgi:uncharacterized protein